MKIKSITLRNYKKFVEEKTFSFCNEDGGVNDITLILGDNGSGKSSLLQAVALLAGVSRPKFIPSKLNYPGFDWEFIQNGKLPVKVSGEFLFVEEEIEATIKYAKKLQESSPVNNFIEPHNRQSIILELEKENDKIKASSFRDFCQMLGYQYALQLQDKTTDFDKLFDDVGLCLWYHEQRTASSISTDISDGNGGFKKFELGELRQSLSAWFRFHSDRIQFKWELKPGQRDFYEKLESFYKNLFKGRSFKGVIPKMNPAKLMSPPDFFLFDGQNDYELSSLSAGERAIFPILIDFANWNINNSIILIDEVELHLHPPLQQALVSMLPKLGKNNQFIITTHSRSVASMFAPQQIIKL